MAINPLIALQGKPINTAAPAQTMLQNQRYNDQIAMQQEQTAYNRQQDTLNRQRQQKIDDEALKQSALDQQLKAQAILKYQHDNMSTAQKEEFQKNLNTAVGLKDALDKNDTQGAINFINQNPYKIDSETQKAALNMLQNGQVDQLKQYTAGLIASGQYSGALKTDIQLNGGGSGGNSVFSATMRMIDADPELSKLPTEQKIRIAQNKIGTNLTFDAQGNVTAMQGAAQGLSNLAYGEKSGGVLGTQAAEAGNLGGPSKADIAGDVKSAEVTGKSTGEAQASYEDFMAELPMLESATSDLMRLADLATYNFAGRSRDSIKRQFGIDVGSAAEAKAKYGTIVKSTVLPTLKATFGGQMSITEGEWLMSTLGADDMSPEEKKAAITARAEGWKRQAEAKARRIGAPEPTGLFKETLDSGNQGPVKFLGFE